MLPVMTDSIRIGTFTLDLETTFRHNTEYAGHNITTRVAPGEYPIELRRSRFNAGPRWYIAIPMPGHTKFWSQSGAHEHDDGYTMQPYPYVLLDMPNTVRLAEGVSIDGFTVTVNGTSYHM
jgi:hypothetical protein